MADRSVPVVLHYRGGRTEYCRTSPRIDPDSRTVTVQHEDETENEVRFEQLKALFFLQTGSPAEPPRGPTLVVEFTDGEVIRGIAPSYSPDSAGFVLYPADRSKNDRVFVLNSAIVSVDVDRT